MEEAAKRRLEAAGIDVDDALGRFLQNEALMMKFLGRFPADTSFSRLQEAMERLQEELYLEMKPKYRTRAAEFHRRFRETTLRRQREQQKGERNHDA